MPFKQHLSSTTGRETFASKVCLRENGGRWLTGGTTGRKRPNNCWGVKVQKIFSLFFFIPFPLGKESFQGPEIVRCYFSSAFFEAQGNLKGHRYSSLVTILFQNWGLFRCCAPSRPPGILCFVLHESHRVYRLRWNCKSFFFFLFFFPVSRHLLPSLPDVAYNAAWLSSAAQILVTIFIFFPLMHKWSRVLLFNL